MGEEFTKAPGQTCGTCLYFESFPPEFERSPRRGSRGGCRRYPPRPDPYLDLWESDWCGEWRPARDGAPAPRG